MSLREPLVPTGFLMLMAVVPFAFFVEAVTGFGSIILTVALAAHFYPLQGLLPVLLPVNVALSLYIVTRHHEAVDWSVLLKRILPLMALGLPLGLLTFHSQPGAWLQLGFALFVVALSALELARHAQVARGLPRPLHPALEGTLLLAGGVIHGLYATGGPLVVYVASRSLPDKRRLRSTLSALWLLLNTVLLSSYAFSGALSGQTLTLSALLLVPLALGLGVGEWVHPRMPQGVFRLLVFMVLLAAGALLAARSRGLP